MSDAADIEVGGHLSMACRFTMAEMAKTDKVKERISAMQATVNSRVQYLRRRYDYQFETHIVDAVTSNRQYVIVTVISTRVE